MHSALLSTQNGVLVTKQNLTPTQLVPPLLVIEKAIREANESPCEKSKRGVVIFDNVSNYTLGVCSHIAGMGHNHQPTDFVCGGSKSCMKNCAKLCIHAEADAIKNAHLHANEVDGYDLLHVKTVKGLLVTSGPPSCWQCSRHIINYDLRGVWLFHKEGWTFYDAKKFHLLTLETCDLRN